MREIIEVRDLTKTFRLSSRQQKLERTREKVRVAVDHLSFSAYEGEIFGLLGPNGAGKTTTLRMLSTLIRPDSGDALLDGVSVVHQPDQVRAKIGFLTSELKLEDCFTPNYLFDFFSALHRVEPAVRDRRREEAFHLVVSIVHDPNIIIFDEPTNGLDVLTAKVVTDFLRELRDQGKTILVSTHIFSLIEKLCSRVGVLIDGRMAVCDTLERVKGGMSLEDRFFEIYQEAAGEAE